DFDFYEQMVSMTDNRVLAMVSSAVRRVYLENGDLFLDLFDPVWFDTARHREAWEAVRARDPERAATAMEAHARAGMGGIS
ncbi:MAG: FCD domain-containing protein, partial [Deltaproteobacteria bacterium]|nr:FCD domain-containing protein [Deltaproteobacteria bacterium]